MTTCRWSQDAGDYLTDDGEPCRHDSEGDPTRHCTARRTCAQHVGYRELTCARCLGRVRETIRKIRDHAPLLPTAAMLAGVNSEAAFLAGPAADYRVFSARRNLDRQWLMANIPERNLERAMDAYLEDDDNWHPYTVLTRWHSMIAEDYGIDLPRRMTITDSAHFLDVKLNVVAQDEAQDFPLLRRELATCWNHMQIPLAIKPWAEKGAPCPDCQPGAFVRLVHEHGHWCTDDDCERIHYLDDSGDRWVCPRNREHSWTEKAYRDYIEERTA